MNGNNISFGMKIIIVIFAIILVVGLMLPFFSSCGTGSSNTDTSDENSQTDSELSTVEGVDKTYQAKIDTYMEDLASDSTSLLANANLGNTYMQWAEALQQVTPTVESTSVTASNVLDGLALSSSASDSLDGLTESASSSSVDGSSAADAQAQAQADLDEHIRETYAAAIPYYDAYLAQHESNAVRVDRAICEYYAGNQEEAISELEQFVQSNDSFSPAWYNLGTFYEDQGFYSSANEAYSSAVSADMEDSYNLAIYAYYRMIALSSYLDSSSNDEDASTSVLSQTSPSSDPSQDADGTTGGTNDSENSSAQ